MQAATETYRERFSRSAVDYAKYRPTYPEELFRFLSSHTAEHNLALDVGTGNGQSARSLVNYYQTVIATDSSLQQILQVSCTNPNVIFKHLPAELNDEEIEENGFQRKSFDLISAAAAVHCFDIDRFHTTVKALLKPRTGLYAVWGYDAATFDNEKIQEIFTGYKKMWDQFATSDRKIYWESKYKALPFPFEEISIDQRNSEHPFESVVEWNQEQFYGYLRSHPSTHLLSDQLGKDSTEIIKKAISDNWGNAEFTVARFPIFMRAGRVPTEE